MSHVDVLIGNELALHREVLAGAFQAMRPDLLVRSVSHDVLDEMIRELRPLLVICSMVSPTISDCSPAWIALYPEERDEAIVSISGKCRTILNATVTELLGVMDEVRSSLSPLGHQDHGFFEKNHSFE